MSNKVIQYFVYCEMISTVSLVDSRPHMYVFIYFL